MSNKESFLQQLDKALSGRQWLETEAARIEKSRQKQEKEEKKQEQGAAKETERQNNQTVLTLDSQLPIREYLEVLKNKIVPLEYVRKNGPKNGRMAYSFIYSSGLKIISKPESEGMTGGFRNYYYKQGHRFGLRVDREILVVEINYKKILSIGVVTRSIGVETNTGLNGASPLEYSFPEIKTEGINPLDREPNYKNSFNVNSEEGVQKFAQALTEFYVGLKTGRGK